MTYAKPGTCPRVSTRDVNNVLGRDDDFQVSLYWKNKKNKMTTSSPTLPDILFAFSTPIPQLPKRTSR